MDREEIENKLIEERNEINEFINAIKNKMLRDGNLNESTVLSSGETLTRLVQSRSTIMEQLIKLYEINNEGNSDTWREEFKKSLDSKYDEEKVWSYSETMKI